MIVPFYKQTFDFSCGPASLMMVLASFKPDYQPNRDEELAIWREATLMEIYGTSRFGLALAAQRRGLRPVVVGEPGRCYVDEIEHLRPEVDFEMMRQFQEDLRQKALSAGIEEVEKSLTLEHIEDCLDRGGFPISLTTTALFDPEEGDIPHWVVLSDIDKDALVAENPLGDEGRTSVGRLVWEAAMGYGEVSEGLLLFRDD